jgi:hypothetical protein
MRWHDRLLQHDALEGPAALLASRLSGRKSCIHTAHDEHGEAVEPKVVRRDSSEWRLCWTPYRR